MAVSVERRVSKCFTICETLYAKRESSKEGGVMKKILFLLLILFLLPIVCQSGEYRLLEGKKEEVCKAYLKNLKFSGEWLQTDMNKQIPFLEEVNWKPSWKRDVEQKKVIIINRDAWDKVFRFVDPDSYPFREKYDFTNYSMREAEIDVDNDGMLDTVYRAESGLWGVSGIYAIYLIIFDKNKNDIDLSKTNKLLGNAVKSGTIATSVMFDAFTFKDQTYFNMWDDRSLENAPKTLTVYLFKDNQVQKKCIYQYRKK
jgi:hypothetical protein